MGDYADDYIDSSFHQAEYYGENLFQENTRPDEDSFTEGMMPDLFDGIE